MLSDLFDNVFRLLGEEMEQADGANPPRASEVDPPWVLHIEDDEEFSAAIKLRLESLEKLADLRADIAGPGKLAGKVGFKIERLGSAVTREFEVKVTNAEVKTVHAITLDGVHIADLNVDLAGKGKLEFSTLRGVPFPHEFQEPRVGSAIEIEGLYKGELHDNLKGHAH